MAGALFSLALAPPATAQVVEASSITSSYSYRVGSQQGSDANAPGTVALFITDTASGFQSDMGLSLTASLNQGSFSFLHNGFCVGDCSLSITTRISFTLTNLGTAPVDLRFDSMITPGHLGRSNFFGLAPGQGGNFLFNVTQDGTQLYGADGVNRINPPIVETSDDVPFNGLAANVNLPAWTVLDWSATNLNLNLLTIGAGQSSTLTYFSTLDVTTTNPVCPDTTQCLGYQVAFGDPRSRGDPTVGISSSSLAPLGALANDLTPFAAPLFPAVGAGYDPFTVFYSFVPQNTPLPPTPPSFLPFDYDIPYGRAPDVIPEPATWAMLLLGFAAIGAVTRRRGQARTPLVA